MADNWELPLLSGHTVEMTEFTDEALEHIADNLKPADREEVHATLGHRRYADALRLSVTMAASVRVAVSAYGEPIAILGVQTVSLIYNTGAPWMLTLNYCKSHRRALMTLGHQYTAAMLERYSELENYVDARHTESVAWLQRLGFTLDEPKPYGPLRLPFHRFHKVR